MFYHLYNGIGARLYDEVANLPAARRESEIFRRTLEEMPIEIQKDDLIAGRYGYEEKPDWADQQPRFPQIPVLTAQEAKDLKVLQRQYAIRPKFSQAHTCIDYGRVIREGLNSYIEDVHRELEGSEGEKRTNLEAMLLSLGAVQDFSRRYAQLAYAQAEQAEGADRERLLLMARRLERVPALPARDFYEAIQSIWIMHAVLPIAERSWCSISLGRLDQYLYPFYTQAVEEGENRETLKAYLKNLFVFLDLSSDSGGDGSCALNLGGMDLEGNDQMNALSELLIEVEKALRLRAPIIAARITPKTPAAILDSLVDPLLFEIGQPTFYGEQSCRNAVATRGVPPEKAAAFSVNSCMGLILPGEEFSDMWGCCFNMHLPLELALNHGKPFHGELPIPLKTQPKTVNNAQELLAQYRLYFGELLHVALRYNRACAEIHAYNRPDPLLSALTDGCIQTGLDRAIGSKYNTVTVETMGLINTGNAMEAIDELVFRQRKYTAEQLIAAAKENYVNSEILLTDIKACKKYGQNEPSPDGFCSALVGFAAEICAEANFSNTQYLPSLHTLDDNVSYGKTLYATLDGRRDGEPVNKNAGPTNDVRKSEPTSMILSAVKLGQTRLSGGQPIDIFFEKSSLRSKELRDKIKSLIVTYLDLGGMQLQVNSVDPKLLRAAYEKPEDYRWVIVRKGGFSLRFCDMSQESQLEMIERAEKENAKC